MRVLIVDDAEVLVQRLRCSLGEAGGTEIAGHAGNAREATRETRQAKPGAVILDIRRAGGSGSEGLEGWKPYPFPPLVIVLSNYSDPPCRQQCLPSGTRFFSEKSGEFHKVAEVLRSLMETARLAPEQLRKG
jgi:DNA-binding NarL/FixJ family response regulator